MTVPATPRVSRLLIANRGEIAVRIAHTARSMGVETVAVYSDADAGAPHVQAMDHAVRIGPESATDSYLNIDAVLDAARRAGADAIHPGYGFLSERPDFAERCASEGLTFVGPQPSAMRASADKAAAKELAARAGVPVVPSHDIANVPADAYPVLVKASAGGGGRGMRVVRTADELPAAVEAARREAAAGFGDDTLIVEALIEHGRHIEVQLLCDSHGTALAIGERDCSLQRRHQKVIEEAPAPGLPAQLRTQILEAGIAIARAAGYTGAGTAEFLVAGDGSFYFLELNARLQVEHPVTELAWTGIDLVEWQIRIARGERIPAEMVDRFSTDRQPAAHAIEARLYAEDPVTLLPTGGRIRALRLPTGDGIRIDHALAEGRTVSLAYDPLLAKIIASGSDRETARRRLISALEELWIAGTTTNQHLLIHALSGDEFAAGTHDITTLARTPLSEDAIAPDGADVAAARRTLITPTAADSPFTPSAGSVQYVAGDGDTVWFRSRGRCWSAPRDQVDVPSGGGGNASGFAELEAPMPGTVIRALDEGAEVRTGEPVVVIEAMKMENAIAAPFDGRVASLHCSVGELVSRGAVLAEVSS